MATPAREEATYEDLLNLPENMTGEIIAGELIVSPRPAQRHIDVASTLGGELVPPFRFGRGGPGGWIIYDEPEIHLGTNVIVPDLAGWKRERLSMAPDEHRFTVPPDWVCEILSPRTARIDRFRKMPIFAEYDVLFAWIIDPILRTLEVFRLESGRWSILGLYAEPVKVRAEPFEQVEIDLAGLWPEEVPGSSTEPCT